VTLVDWRAWHDEYDRPDSSPARRLKAVRRQVGAALDACPPGPLRVVSPCAGQGRDLPEVLDGHSRRADVRARLVELDERNTGPASAAVEAAGLDGVEVLTADAALTECTASRPNHDLWRRASPCSPSWDTTRSDGERPTPSSDAARVRAPGLGENVPRPPRPDERDP
jgi:hypothetical protein